MNHHHNYLTYQAEGQKLSVDFVHHTFIQTFLFCPLYMFIHFLHLFVQHTVPWIWLGIMRHRNVHYYYVIKSKVLLLSHKPVIFV